MTSCFELGGLDNARNVMGLVTCGSISDLLAKLSLLPFSSLLLVDILLPFLAYLHISYLCISIFDSANCHHELIDI